MNSSPLKQPLQYLTFGVVLVVFAFFANLSNANMLELPIDCEFGKTCFIQKYHDANQGKSYRDYRCGMLTNDGHKVQTFALWIMIASTKVLITQLHA